MECQIVHIYWHVVCTLFLYVHLCIEERSGHNGKQNWITASKPQTHYVQKVPQNSVYTCINQPKADLIASIPLCFQLRPTCSY